MGKARVHDGLNRQKDFKYLKEEEGAVAVVGEVVDVGVLS